MNDNSSYIKESSADVEKNKSWAILAYIIFLIPLLAAPKDSQFVRYHVNQGLILAITSISLSIICGILSSIFTGLVAMLIPYSVLILGSIFSFIWLVIIGVVLALVIKGIISASKGEMKPLPIIGKFKILT